MNPEIFQQLILAVALAIVSLLCFAMRELITLGIAYLRAKLGQTQYDRVRAFADTIVKAVEQSPIYQDFTGDKKKELARVAVVQFAKEHNLPIDEALFDKFIEAAVKEMNGQIGQIDWIAGELIQGPTSPMIESGN
jgi:hypothetical protein